MVELKCVPWEGRKEEKGKRGGEITPPLTL